MSRIHYAVAFAISCWLSVSNLPASDKEGFIVHEWGTFSTFSGSDGKPLRFVPNDIDLPSFVHNHRQNVKGIQPDALVSLETPVIYFYTDRDRTVSVKVDFPKGTITDWYPEASRPPAQQIRWDNLRLKASEKPSLAGERDTGRYFAAREVDASYVSTAERIPQNEKFLFYRGTGDFVMPFEVRALGAGKFAVTNNGTQLVFGHFLINVQDHKLKFQAFGKLAAGGEEKVALPKETSTVEKLSEAMAKLLTEQGLYEKEAKAMVKTWKDDWFGETGTRVLYLVAEPVTAELLPLMIEPMPDKVVRVLVGRHDVLSPEQEKDVDALVKRLQGESNDDAKAADKELEKLGRYRTAAQTASVKRLQAAGAVRR